MSDTREYMKKMRKQEQEGIERAVNKAVRELAGKSDEAIANALILMADKPGSFSRVGREALLRVAGQRLRWKAEVATVEEVVT